MATVGVLGAGLSGIAMAIRLHELGLDDFVVHERERDVGGTWLVNTYPGLHCDIPSHLYCFSFAPNPDFSMVFAPRDEIQGYLRDCAERYGIIDRIEFGSGVERAEYDSAGAWQLEMADGGTRTHRVLVSATGGLTAPHFPRIDGLDRFAGPSWHSAAWRHDVDLAGRRVAVVGSAASAVQVVPEVAKVAAEVTVFSRTPNWVTPRNNRIYSDEEKAGLRREGAWERTRRGQYRDSMLWQGAFEKEQKAIEELRQRVMGAMHAAIDDPDLIDALTPDYEPGCKRILTSDDYYLTLAMEHVRLVPQGVAGLTEHEVVAEDGSTTETDIVIFCTGYRLGGRADGSPAVNVVGRDGIDMRTALARAPESYRGVATPGFPNYFTVGGINGAPGHAPVFLTAEVAADYIARCVDHLVTHDLTSIEVDRSVTSSYSAAVQAELQQMSWAGDCPGWYRDKQGRILPFFPGSWGRMRREMRDLHLEDFILEP